MLRWLSRIFIYHYWRKNCKKIFLVMCSEWRIWFSLCIRYIYIIRFWWWRRSGPSSSWSHCRNYIDLRLISTTRPWCFGTHCTLWFKPISVCSGQERSEHYFMDCFHYIPEHQTLLNLVDQQYVPRISKRDKKYFGILIVDKNCLNSLFLQFNFNLE